MTLRVDSRYPLKEGDTGLMYLRRDQTGVYTTHVCSGNSLQGGYHWRLAFERKQAANARNLCEPTKMEMQSAYDRADLVVYAKIERIVRKGLKWYADLNIRKSWKTGAVQRDVRISIGDAREDCGYYPVPGMTHILYLRRDKSGAFSTDAYSGNMHEETDLTWAIANRCFRNKTQEERCSEDKYPFFQHMQWLDSQEHRHAGKNPDAVHNDAASLLRTEPE
ncbi:MAG: hypothetical protein LBS89_08835 [Zoogloeaceae bacterium]|jgi:hypothetical protein|nr:hypothetical protein [Zoogloeaceae bacterium]